MNNSTNETETKVCNKCEREFPLTDTYWRRTKQSKDGFNTRCKECKGSKFQKTIPKIVLKHREGYKTCNRCFEESPSTTEYFSRAIRAKKGLSVKCKKCEKTLRQGKSEEQKKYAREWFRRNKEKEKERKKRWLENNQEWHKEYSEKNKEHIAKVRKEYIKKHPEVKAKANRNYRVKNKDKHRIWRAERKSRLKNLESRYSEKDWKNVKKEFGYKCCYCGQRKALTQDHFIALSKGGEYTINNIIPSCQSCNTSKNNRDFFNWYPTKEYYSKKREQKILKYLNYKSNKTQQLALL